MNKLLVGEKIILRPATLSDKRKIFDWLTNSNLTKEMIGPPDYPDAVIPTWDEFDNDYIDYYFDGSEPAKGRCFIIICDGQEIGQINYNKIGILNKKTDLDIWLNDIKYTGKGYGPESINLLCDYLHEEFGCRIVILSPSKRNRNAIRSYEKAGFVMTNDIPDKSEMDYDDNVIMIKIMDDHNICNTE